MATVVFAAIGTALGGPIGGAIGALVGQQVDAAVFAPAGREGPRLSDLTLATSTYGAPIGRHFGRMRVGGTIIWATDLHESSETSGGGKGRPSVTTYSYSASFAVALASQPITDIGRIWADGNLLRGGAGDLKVGGHLRIYTGHGDQAPDPLLAAAEGLALCPAYRGTAYAVFEDLQLGDFGNRIPALSFEVFGSPSPLALADLVAEPGADVSADVSLAGIDGLSIAGPLADPLAVLAAVIPFGCDVAGGQLALFAQPLTARALGEPLVRAADDGSADGAFGGKQGFARKRLPPAETRIGGLRYYDVDRDYQPGLQHAAASAAAIQPRTLELPLALTAGNARALVGRAARRDDWARQSLAWRTAEVDPAIGPGALVRVPGQPGLWRVSDWEWRAGGIELALWRVPAAVPLAPAESADGGRSAVAPDLVNGPTELRAFELPWDGTGSGSSGVVYVAASSAASGWAGAAVYAVDGGGGLQRVGSTGRLRCAIGQAVTVLPAATPLLPDRASSVIVELVADDLDLTDADGRQLAKGANRALLGAEIIQFGSAVPLGHRRWRLTGLLRGRGGTEAATDLHVLGEGFVMLDDRIMALDPALVGSGTAQVAALGLADPAEVVAAIALRGIATRPLCPVQPRIQRKPDGSLALAWTRRARGAWSWPDGVDAPLHEEAELYEVLVGPEASPLAAWQTGQPAFTIAPDQADTLRKASPGAPVLVRQRGSYGVSAATLLTEL